MSKKCDKKLIDKVQAFFQKFCLFSVALLIVFLPISPAAVESSIGLLFLCAVITVSIKRPGFRVIQRFFSFPINLLALVFLFCFTLSFLASGEFLQKSIGAWLSKWMEAVIVFFIIQMFVRRASLKVFFTSFFISGALLFMDGIYQKITGVDFLRQRPLIRSGNSQAGITASLKHYNSFGLYSAVYLFLFQGVSRFFYARKVLFLASLLGILLGITSLLFSYSRGAWVSFIVVLTMALFFVTEKKIRRKILIFLSIFILLILSTPFLRDRLLWVFFEKEGLGSGRFLLWKPSFAMIKDSPLIGQGLGLFMDRLKDYWMCENCNKAQYAHNSYLQVFAETGLIGAGTFFWFLFELMRRSCQYIRRGHLDFSFLSIFLGVAVFLIHAFFDNHFFSLQLSTLFWVLAGALTALLREEEGFPK